MTDEKIRSAVEIAQKAIDLAHRVPPEGLKKSKELMTLAHAVVELSAELAALKEKYRWRRLSETKPSVEDAPLEIVYFTNDNHFDVRLAPVWPGGLAYADGYYKYWRPWDLPEEETK